MSEPELIGLIRDGAARAEHSASIRQALEELLERQYGWLRRMCMLEFRFTQEAEDCLQEVLVEISRSIQAFNGRSELKTWLFIIAKRTIYRMKKRMRTRELRFPLGTAADVAEKDTVDVHVRDTESVLAEKETTRNLVRILRELPDKQRWAVFFHYFEDLSLEDAADRLGCSVGSVKKHLFRGRQKIKERLEREAA